MSGRNRARTLHFWNKPSNLTNERTETDAAMRVSDPYSMIRIRIQHFRLNTDPDAGFWWPKFTAEKKFWGSKTTICLSLGLHKRRPSYRRSLQPSKENIKHFKTWNFLIFFYFCRSFLASWIRILNPDPKHCMLACIVPYVYYIHLKKKHCNRTHLPVQYSGRGGGGGTVKQCQ